MEVVIQGICAHKARETGVHRVGRCDGLLRRYFAMIFLQISLVALENENCATDGDFAVLRGEGGSSSSGSLKKRAERVR